MFSSSGVQRPVVSNPQTPGSLSRRQSQSLPQTAAAGSTALQAPSINGNQALLRIEELLEAIVDAIASDDELVIPYQSTRSSQNGANSQTFQEDGRHADVVRFPGRTVQEAKRFGKRDEAGWLPFALSSRFGCHARGPLPHNRDVSRGFTFR